MSALRRAETVVVWGLLLLGSWALVIATATIAGGILGRGCP